MITANEVFIEAFNNVANVLEYNPEWANSTGYLDYAARGEDAPKLAIGEMAKFVDAFGRKAIVIGLGLVTGRDGRFDTNIVLFERYTNSDSPIVQNTCGSITKAFDLCGALSSEKVGFILGDPPYPTICMNLGKRIDSIKNL